MDEFLIRHALIHSKLGISKTWVLCEENKQLQKKPIAAYFTLSTTTVLREDVPLNKSHPRYPLPSALLAKLAVSKFHQKNGLGEKTVIYAIREAVSLTERGLPAIGIVLDVMDQDALKFYQKFESFEEFTDNPMRLFMPMNVAKQI